MKQMVMIGIIQNGIKTVLTKEGLTIGGVKVGVCKSILDDGNKNQNAPKVDISA